MRDDRPFGRYRLLRELGRGGMGSVHEAEDSVLRRRVAVKLLPAGLADDKAALQRFIREARAAAALNHPNVVTVHDVGRHEGQYFIAMELVRGESAEKRLQRGPIDWREATRIVIDVCRGLSAAHRAGLIHRDVKPANILLSADGHVKLADFGLVRPGGADAAGLTSQNAVLGTPHYMSPEQCRGEKISRLSDLYALGAVWFALMTGRPPYHSPDVMRIMFAHCSEPVPDPRSVRPEIPEACFAVLRKAMAREPMDRFESAEEMQQALSELLNEPTQVMSSRPSSSAAAFSDAKIADSSALFQFGADIPDTAAASTRGELPETRIVAPVGRTSSKRGRERVWLMSLAGVLAVVSLIIGLLIAMQPKDEEANGAATNTTREAGRIVPSGDWTPLFNGKDLTGLFAQPGNTDWTVKDQLLVGTGEMTFCFTQRSDYKNFRCRAEMKLNAGANSGLYFRCDSDPGLPFGYEAQLGENDYGRLFRNIQHQNNPEIKHQSVRIAPETWFTVMVEAIGPRITLWINDEQTLVFEEKDMQRPRGHLAIQSGTAGSIVTVRKFEVQELP